MAKLIKKKKKKKKENLFEKLLTPVFDVRVDKDLKFSNMKLFREKICFWQICVVVNSNVNDVLSVDMKVQREHGHGKQHFFSTAPNTDAVPP